jgi:hypothetical protein
MAAAWRRRGARELTRIKRGPVRAPARALDAGQGGFGGPVPRYASNPSRKERPMLFTTPDPISPPQVLELIRVVRAVDTLAEVRVDETGRQVQISGKLTAQQAATALGSIGLAGVVTGAAHVSGGSTCCGSCG